MESLGHLEADFRRKVPFVLGAEAFHKGINRWFLLTLVLLGF